jgi:adenylate cyclase
MHLSQTRDANGEAIALLLRAIELEPNNPTFLVYAGNAMLHRSTMGWAAGRHRRHGTRHRTGGAGAGERPRRRRGGCRSGSMMLIHNLHDYDRGLVLTQRAVESNPNNLTVMIFAGITHRHLGSIDGAIAFSEHAIRLSPSLDGAHWPLTAISHAQMIKGGYEEALVWAKRSISANPSFVCSYWMLVAARCASGADGRGQAAPGDAGGGSPPA